MISDVRNGGSGCALDIRDCFMVDTHGHDTTRLLSSSDFFQSRMNQNAHIDLNKIRSFSHEFQIISFRILDIQTMTVPVVVRRIYRALSRSAQLASCILIYLLFVCRVYNNSPPKLVVLEPSYPPYLLITCDSFDKYILSVSIGFENICILLKHCLHQSWYWWKFSG